MDLDDASAVNEQPADDLRAIRGIGPEIARRLRDGGVRTFADLARHSLSEIARKARIQAQRVEREDWIGQASALVEQTSRADAERSKIASDDAERRESFVLRLTLDDDNHVIRTVVTHVRSEREAPSWAGWNTARLLEFLSEYMDLGDDVEARPANAATPSPAAWARAAPARPVIAAVGESEPALPTHPPVSDVRLRELEVVSAASGVPRRSLEAGEPFTVRLAFDLEGAEAFSRTPLAYTVNIVARTVGERRRQTETVGLDDGTLSAGGVAAVEVRSAGLSSGFYRLEGALRLREPDSARPRGLVALEGGLLQVG